MKSTWLYITMLLVFSMAVMAMPVKADVAAVSQLGYHPSASKQLVLYTGASSGTFTIYSASTNAAVATFQLSKPTNYYGSQVTCQGSTPCLVGDFSSLSSSGTYYIKSSTGAQSPNFYIGTNAYSKNVPLYLEFFDAMLQQHSNYHVDWHTMQNPPFTSMADASFIMEADQAAIPLIRMGSAYRRNPQLFKSDKYNVLASGKADMQEYMLSYAQYLSSLQINGLSVSQGWDYNFDCWPLTDPATPMWTTTTDSCMKFISTSSRQYTSMALLAFVEAVPALNDYSSQTGQSYIQRSIDTYAYIKSHYSAFASGDSDAGYFGAAAFLLYDYTGNSSYLTTAYNMRTLISTTLQSDITHGNEFYWEEYIRHKSAITNAGLSYQYTGVDPENFFRNKIYSDYKDMGANSISNTGEKMYQFDNGIHFQNSRYMLIEAIYASKATQYYANIEPFIPKVADSQLAWLTGTNYVQSGTGAGTRMSLSFVFGIGKFPAKFHSRYVNLNTDSVTFTNGMHYISGWINGAFDENGDGIFNYYDNTGSWEYTETTNEMVAEEMELASYLDARYNNIAMPAWNIKYSGNILPPPPSGNSTNDTLPPPPNTSQTVYYSLQGMPATCTGGTITSDIFNGGRDITCTSSTGSLRITAWDKPSSTNPQYFEMYRQSQSGTLLKICLLSTCISDNGFARSPNYPLYGTGTTPPPATNITNSTNSTTPPPSNATLSAVLSIAPWYPQGRNYVFICTASGFSPSGYDWIFGDGSKQLGMISNNVYHTYSAAGAYNVQCTAKTASQSATGKLTVNVS